jgi:hypothetical protein
MRLLTGSYVTGPNISGVDGNAGLILHSVNTIILYAIHRSEALLKRLGLVRYLTDLGIFHDGVSFLERTIPGQAIEEHEGLVAAMDIKTKGN